MERITVRVRSDRELSPPPKEKAERLQQLQLLFEGFIPPARELQRDAASPYACNFDEGFDALRNRRRPGWYITPPVIPAPYALLRRYDFVNFSGMMMCLMKQAGWYTVRFPAWTRRCPKSKSPPATSPSPTRSSVLSNPRTSWAADFFTPKLQPGSS